MKKLLALFSIVFALNANASNHRLDTDIVDTAVKAGQFNTLVAAVGAAGLVEALKADGPLTVFAPTDEAFTKLPPGTVESLLGNIPALTNILTYHVVSGEPKLKKLAKKGKAETLQGQMLKFTKTECGKYFVNGAQILKQVKVKNGQILVVDSVLLPQTANSN